MRAAFVALWVAQFVSLLASDVTQFALRLALYQRSGSVTSYALFTFCAEVPARLLAPFAGAVVDRYDRKTVMLLADSLTAACNLAVYFGFVARGGGGDGLSLGVLYAAAAFSGVMNAFQWPAFVASVSLLARDGERVRYAGAQEAAPALSMLLSPALAGWMVAADPSLRLVFANEFASFTLAVLVTSLAAVPRLETAAGTAGKGVRKTAALLAADAREAVAWAWARPGLLALVALKSAGMFVAGATEACMTPVILHQSSPQSLGAVLTLSGTGAVFGSALTALFGRVERRAPVVLGLVAVQGTLLALAGLAPSIGWVLAVAFVYSLLLPPVRACRQALLQAKTPPEMHGRVFALQRGVAGLAMPVAAALAGPIVDRVLEPGMASGGGLARVFGPLVGTGPGRGAALGFVALGAGQAALAACGYAFRPLREADTAYATHEAKKRE